jgi:hypothetical protein
MLRRIALTLVPCVALYTVAAFLAPSLTTRAELKKSHVAPSTTPVQQVAARSGYIVASS